MSKLNYLSLLFLIFCCQNSSEKKPTDDQNLMQFEFLEVKIVTRVNTSNETKVQRIGIFSHDDTCKYREISENYDNKIGKYVEKKDTVTEFTLNKKERVQLYNLFQNLLTSEIRTFRPIDETIVCHFGPEERNTEVSFIIHSSPTISCHYGSVDKWEEISPTHRKIYNLTFGRLKGKN